MKDKNKDQKCGHNHCAPNNPVYGVGMIGAFIFYISHAQSFMEGVMGFLKALVWPAILVYKALEMIS